MPAPNNPNVARVTYMMHRGTRVVENTFHLYRSAGWTYDSLLLSLEAAYTLWNTYAKPAIPSSIGLYNIHGVVYDPNGSPWVADRPVVPEMPGGVTTGTEPGNVTVTVSERANLAGRAYRGRIYWPAIGQGMVAGDDTITSALVGLLGTFAMQWLNTFGVNGSNGTLVIFHRNDNLFSTVRALVIESILDSQRRRLPGRGI
jgi:hypothetical protein